MAETVSNAGFQPAEGSRLEAGGPQGVRIDVASIEKDGRKWRRP